MSEPLVRVRGLTVDYLVEGRLVRAVDGVDLDLEPGGSLGLVGESGSGKSTIAFALSRFLPPGATITADELTVDGADVLGLDATGLRRFRRTSIGFVYQEPGRALNPTRTVGSQVAEAHRIRGLSRRDARAAVQAGFADVGLPEPDRIAHRYPHELSGGQQQRVVIAMALAARPRLLLLDEPTTGLDSNVEADVLALIERLREEQGFASILISHDLPLVARHARRIGVLEQGVLVERGDADRVLTRPEHDYSRALVAAVPRLDGIEVGRRPLDPRGSERLLEVRGLAKRYGRVTALAGVDLDLHAGEVLGVVGESGSGKTTLGRAIAGLTRHDGTVRVTPEAGAAPVQFVFQSPDASLNPRRTVRQTLQRAIALLGGESDAATLAERTGLPVSALDKLPGELSGGQKQRVAIARAFAGRARIVVCDEPTSALDVSVQARVLDLLDELRERTGVSYLFISHDLAVVRRLAHRVIVLKGGHVVDRGTADEVFSGDRHPYTESLLSAARGLRAPALAV